MRTLETFADAYLFFASLAVADVIQDRVDAKFGLGPVGETLLNIGVCLIGLLSVKVLKEMTPKKAES